MILAVSLRLHGEAEAFEVGTRGVASSCPDQDVVIVIERQDGGASTYRLAGHLAPPAAYQQRQPKLGPMLTEGHWYTLPDGTRVQACEQTMRGMWHLCTADGTPAYVVFAGTQIRRLVAQGL